MRHWRTTGDMDWASTTCHFTLIREPLHWLFPFSRQGNWRSRRLTKWLKITRTVAEPKFEAISVICFSSQPLPAPELWFRSNQQLSWFCHERIQWPWLIRSTFLEDSSSGLSWWRLNSWKFTNKWIKWVFEASLRLSFGSFCRVMANDSENQNQGSTGCRKYYRARHEKTWVLIPLLSFTSHKRPPCLHLWKGDKWSYWLSLSVFDWIEWGYAWKSSMKWNIKTPSPLIALIFITQIR